MAKTAGGGGGGGGVPEVICGLYQSDAAVLAAERARWQASRSVSGPLLRAGGGGDYVALSEHGNVSLGTERLRGAAGEVTFHVARGHAATCRV